MPPQALALGAVLGWNFQRSRTGKVTISMFARRHPIGTAVVLVVGNGWLVPHLYPGLLERP